MGIAVLNPSYKPEPRVDGALSIHQMAMVDEKDVIHPTGQSAAPTIRANSTVRLA
jgi:hypothetical protein